MEKLIIIFAFQIDYVNDNGLFTELLSAFCRGQFFYKWMALNLVGCYYIIIEFSLTFLY